MVRCLFCLLLSILALPLLASTLTLLTSTLRIFPISSTSPVNMFPFQRSGDQRNAAPDLIPASFLYTFVVGGGEKERHYLFLHGFTVQQMAFFSHFVRGVFCLRIGRRPPHTNTQASSLHASCNRTAEPCTP